MTPRSFPKRSPTVKRELVPADSIATAVHDRVSPSVAAAFAGTKFAICVSVISVVLSIVSIALWALS